MTQTMILTLQSVDFGRKESYVVSLEVKDNCLLKGYENPNP